MVQSFAISGFAAEASVPAEDPDADSFFAFDSGVARMDSDGSFTFSFNSSFTVSANDTKTSHTFSNLTVGAEYDLEFESETTLGARIRFDGKGKVSNVTVI